MNKLTRKVSLDSKEIYKPGEDSFNLHNIIIAYPASLSRKNSWLRIEVEYKDENYDSLITKLFHFDKYLEKQLPYFNEFKYRLYKSNSYSTKRNDRLIIKTHVQLMHSLGVYRSSVYPEMLSPEKIHKRIKDSLKAIK